MLTLLILLAFLKSVCVWGGGGGEGGQTYPPLHQKKCVGGGGRVRAPLPMLLNRPRSISCL